MSPALLRGARFVLIATASGAALLGIAMALYPGGTALDPHARGHSFWLNMLCDLTEPVARNGAPNRPGALVARVAMLDLTLALGATWLVVPALLDDGRAPGRVVRVAGVVCVAGLLAVPFLEDTAHAVAIFTSAAAGLLAGVVTLAALVRGGGPARRWLLLGTMLAATALAATCYARSFATHPRVVHASVPVTQRVAVLLALAWMLATALELVRRAGPRAAPGRSRP
jgi:hypothetical protein